ncbi:two component transcriptional regulator, winged helix family [Sulfurimonas denitrificans DSM 1251]|jgi:DNA-binding response OmpR family regulator|uniref:Two component transcriptional regulator, winged helix family n=1 Tax=Sulfurimonas denitrificans (strain ATCC 33889 / DSM 1251) TaxID=326298 RepID=Q30PC7_SULDN|nr:response regulator transcription factor [Sulfurimonas denitrificans]ABB45154.1 two component transcriptional regulator, winged helix family [Sulfurimonas denitrificans DSM 1251]MDD3442779.1 response regulator transcription factor [Sulfurimonas denitrificans]
MQAIHKKLHSLTLLIAEDDESTLKWLSRVLSIYFKEVRVAKDAMEALELFEQTPSDVIISDIQMPQVDGLHLLQKISLLSPSTTRVVMTAYNTPEYINRAVESNVDFYLKKPIDIDEFLVAIASSRAKVDEQVFFLNEGYMYDYKQKLVKKDEQSIKLTKKEVLLLELLLKNRKSIVSIEQIEHSVWEESVSDDAIRMVVVGIRKKLYQGVIENVKGLGYRVE